MSAMPNANIIANIVDGNKIQVTSNVPGIVRVTLKANIISNGKEYSAQDTYDLEFIDKSAIDIVVDPNNTLNNNGIDVLLDP